MMRMPPQQRRRRGAQQHQLFLLVVVVVALLVTETSAIWPFDTAEEKATTGCYDCDCMQCVGSTEPDVTGLKTVMISSANCKPGTINWMCCTGSKLPDGTPSACETDVTYVVATGGTCDANRCILRDVLKVKVPADASHVHLQAQDFVFRGDAAEDLIACGAGALVNEPTRQRMCSADGATKINGVCDVWVDLANCGCDGYCIGDPHFKTWAGQWYDFHGACDLVFLTNPSFQNGKGLDIHIRTTLRDDFSYIEAAAVKIGEDMFEVGAWGEYLFNGVDYAEFPLVISGLTIHYDKVNNKKHHFIIEYAPGQSIRVDTVKDLVNVQMVNASMVDFEDSLGLMGKFSTGRLVGRDGVTDYGFFDNDNFGKEWQVRANEPMLFETARFPQAPEQCTMPPPKTEQSRRRRLGESYIPQHDAEQACAHWPDAHSQSLCVSDVIAMKDLEVAQAGVF